MARTELGEMRSGIGSIFGISGISGSSTISGISDNVDISGIVKITGHAPMARSHAE